MTTTTGPGLVDAAVVSMRPAVAGRARRTDVKSDGGASEGGVVASAPKDAERGAAAGRDRAASWVRALRFWRRSCQRVVAASATVVWKSRIPVRKTAIQRTNGRRFVIRDHYRSPTVKKAL